MILKFTRVFLSGIGARIFFSFNALLVLLLLLLSVFGLRYSQKTTQDNAANQLRVLSVALSQQVHKYLQEAEQNLTIMATPKGILHESLLQDPFVQENVNEYLRKKISQINAFELFFVLNKNGVVVAASQNSWLQKNMKKEAIFTNGLKKLYYAEIYEDEELNKVVLIALPIGANNFASGVLVAQLKLDALYEMMGQKLGLRGSAEAFLLDSKLRFITPGKTAPDELLDSHLNQTLVVKHLKEEFWVDAYLNYDNEKVLGTVSQIKDYPWFLVIELDYSEIEGKINQIKRYILTLTAVLILAAIVVSIMITLSITKPLQRLVEETRRMKEGDLRSPIVIAEGAHEILFLAAEFETMRVHIAHYQNQLLSRLEVSEQRRVESERLAAIGTMAASLAHEIRNPLNAMGLLLSQLQIGKASLDKQKEIIQNIRSEISRLDRLMSDLLDFAKPLQLHPKKVCVQKFLQDLWMLFQPVFNELHIQAVLDMPEPAVMLDIDTDKMKQALMNVIQNSLDAIKPTDGTLWMRLQVFDSHVLISIEDNGSGISTDHQGRIFDLFFTTKAHGTGLGLSIVRKIIDAHQGSISIESKVLVGTHIKIHLPLHLTT